MYTKDIYIDMRLADMKTVSINYILHNRPYISSFKKEIANISSKVKSNLTINLLVSNLNRDWKADKEDLEKCGIKTNVFLVEGGNYMLKILTGIDSYSEYSIKLDEDIFLSTAVWDFFLDNIDILENETNLFLSPILNNGIPSVDLFIDQFCNAEEKQILNKIFLRTSLPSIWGADYSKLENHTTKAHHWSSENFYNEVAKINHYYKGVHPVRFSADAQNYILDVVLKRFDKILNCSNMSFFYDKKPYFCNSVFGIKTETWHKIVNDKSLFKDEFEEVPLNLYREENNLSMVFINNGFGVHPSYNTINVFGADYKELSDRFFSHEYFKK